MRQFGAAAGAGPSLFPQTFLAPPMVKDYGGLVAGAKFHLGKSGSGH